MPETVKREYTGMSKSMSIKRQGKANPGTGPKFPKVPASRDGKYEGTAAGKTKLAKF
jgi:hypothetical protein